MRFASTPSQLKVVRTDSELECPLIDAGLRARGLELLALPEMTSEEHLIEALENAHLLLTCYARITARVIESAPFLRGIVKYGVGIDAIDIEAARRREIPVVNIPEYAEETVAEGAFALMIALARKLGPLHMEMQARHWAWPTPQWMGADLAGKTLGLIGVGRIGRSLARMAGAGFRMNVLGYDPFVDQQSMEKVGVQKSKDLSTLLENSDFVSLHAVLNPQTRHLIGRAELERMKPTAILVNVSRGALVDEAALSEALISGKIAGAGLDVFSQEPLSTPGHHLQPLFHLPNVIMTPHLTFYTREAMQRLEEETLLRCDEILSDSPVQIKSRDPRLRSQTSRVKLV